MTSTSHRWQWSGHLVTALLIIAVVVTAWRVITLYYERSRRQDLPQKHLSLGDPLTLPEVKWASAPRHVVLAIRVSCPACNSSVQFYRELAKRLGSRTDTKIIVVSPNPPDVIQGWLSANSIPVFKVVSSTNLVTLGIGVTPTLVMVDGNGTVTDIMVTKLSADEEGRVLARLGGAETAPLNNTKYAVLIDEAGLNELREHSTVVLIDARDRGSYARAHRVGAINIPRDELQDRAPVELSLHLPIVVDCVGERYVRCEMAGESLFESGADQVYILMPKLPD
jgi:rhodanese-related sulfurtransferase